MNADVTQDGCYHCSFAHPGLSQALDINAYHNVLYEKVSFQVSPLRDADDRPSDGQWHDIIASRIEGMPLLQMQMLKFSNPA